MNEFIEKLIGRLEEEKAKGFYDSDSVIGEKNVWAKSIEIINQLAEEYKGGWIPCSEKLPDKDMWCWATFESGGIDKIQYLVTNKWGWNGEFADNKVVAWMPLPKPFKPKGE